MTPDRLLDLLTQVRNGACRPEEAVEQLAQMPFDSLDEARPDTHRAIRCGHAETIFAEGKTPEQVVRVLQSGLTAAPCVLATRMNAAHIAAVLAQFPDAVINEKGRTARVGVPQQLKPGGRVLVVTAGTSDIPVAEEALATLEAFGNPGERICDVGVAGLHRLLAVLPTLRSADVIITVAGMEGALPSVVGGLVKCPVVAVPASVGYGANFGGLAALLGALNSCAAGVVAVNIDNGFGAAMAALRILSLRNPV